MKALNNGFEWIVAAKGTQTFQINRLMDGVVSLMRKRSLKGDEGGRLPSSESPGSSGNQISDDVDTSMLSIAAALADVEFHGVEEAYARYVEYAKATRFAVRKGDSIKDDEGNVVRKFFYCNQQGLPKKKHYERADRKRAHKAETRTSCNAKFVVFLDKQNGKWRMKTFVQDHNHDLTLPAFTNVMASHSNINEELEKDALSMRLELKKWCKDAKSRSFHDSDGGMIWFVVDCLPPYVFVSGITSCHLLKEVEAKVPKGNSSTFVHATADGCDILDPKIIKSKGAPRSTSNGRMGRRCKRCHGFGHDRRNCTTNKEDILDEPLRSNLRQSQHGGKRSCRAKNGGLCRIWFDSSKQVLLM
ncbi:hypothetical protein AHAS_Ahas11G0087900 [Arachis hypogaea]